MLGNFQAGTQYGDWEGTASADEPGADNAFEELFVATGKVDPEKEILIGFKFSFEEESIYFVGYFHAQPKINKHGSYPSLKEEFQKNESAPIQIKEVRVEITLEQFFKYFKRFDVVFVQSALGIIGREFKVSEDD